ELKAFHIRDGLGIKLWQRAGFRFGVLTARTSHIVKLRAGELGIDLVRQGFEDKLPAAQEMIRDCGLTPEKVCYIGDDLTDLPVIRHVGLGAAVNDAAAEVRTAAAYVTQLSGGRGAVRELVEKIIKTDQFTLLIQDYRTPDGKLELTPCLLIFYSAPPKDPPAADPAAPKSGRPIILRAPKAELVFERPLDLTRADFGRVEKGTL